ncbi:MAG: hypothetical protein GF341_10635 [candidate division Zixibacteria bacterium]|nr:hypothetical protein [candidate division Zixibacteria bacterium]
MNVIKSLRVALCLAVVVVMMSAVAGLAATSYTSHYFNGALTVTVATPVGDWDDLEIECLDTDVPADFSTTTPEWAIDPDIDTIAGKTYVRLERTAAISTGETVVIQGPSGRGGDGTIARTLAGVLLDQAKLKPTFIAVQKVPSLTTWGIVILVLGLVIVAGWLMRRKRQPLAA